MEMTEGLSYDDVLLRPNYAGFLPGDACTKTVLAKDIVLNIPVISAAMDTVTEEDMAIAIALEGGAGVIHRNLSPKAQATQVAAVKRFLNWIIDKPITVRPDLTIGQVRELAKEYGFSGMPVVDKDNVLKGIITGRDIKFCNDDNLFVKDLMTTELIVENENPTPESAQQKFNEYKIEKLPVVDSENKLIGLITVKDIEKHEKYPNAAIDSKGRLIVGAAISPNDWKERIPLLIESNVDFVALDTAHGDSFSVIEAIREIKKTYDITVLGGNVATPEGTKRLIEAGADAVKVGVGPGSICTTRIIAGIGVPQFTAVYECALVAEKYNIPIIADGGVKFSGDLVKAIGAGASVVMVGNLLAGLKESPGAEIIYDGRMFKTYRGMGSVGAISEGSGDRYQMKKGDAPVPEGIEGRVPYKGEMKNFMNQIVTGLKKGMGYCGCNSIEQLRNYKKFVRITASGLRESHAHDVHITHEAPNYSKY